MTLDDMVKRSEKLDPSKFDDPARITELTSSEEWLMVKEICERLDRMLDIISDWRKGEHRE